MVIQYKCKCNCTSIEQLNFNGRDICKKRIQNEIIHDLQPNNIEYIQQIQIVTKKITVRRMGIERPFTLKTIEFLLALNGTIIELPLDSTTIDEATLLNDNP